MHFDAEVEEETGINEDLAHEDTDNVFIVGPPANGKETQL
jgi:type IV secretory pathway ATPase VirB11/archaellum biosynthesis ATPase